MAEADLPCNDEAERTILGAALVEPLSLASSAALLKAGDFYSLRHRTIFEALLELADDGKGIDIVILKDHLLFKGELERAGGRAYLASLMDGVPRIMNTEHWARIVRDRAIQRRVIQAGARVQALAREAPDGASAVAAALEAISASADESVTGSFGNPREDLKAGLDLLEAISRAERGMLGVSTGLGDLDERLGGLKTGELVILAARPAMGKTSLALAIGEAVAASGKAVAMFSLEMTADQLSMRRLCSAARLSSQSIRATTEKGWGRLAKAFGDLQARPFYVDETFFTTATQIRAKARRQSVELGGLGLVIVDYLQLIEGAGEENRNQEVSVVTRSLKGLAKELGVPVLAVSQLSRAGARRSNPRPVLSDLRDSGSIEQDADVVLFIHRQEELDPGDSEWQGIAEIIVGKQRNGPTGTVRAAFVKEYARFEDLHRAEEWMAA